MVYLMQVGIQGKRCLGQPGQPGQVRTSGSASSADLLGVGRQQQEIGHQVSISPTYYKQLFTQKYFAQFFSSYSLAL